MKLSRKPELQKVVQDRVKSGKYATPEDVVAAGILALDQQDRFGDFARGELDQLLREGEQSISRKGTVDGDQAFRRRRRDRARKRAR